MMQIGNYILDERQIQIIKEENNYVLVNTSTGSKYIYMNGGNLYCPKGSKYYSYGNVSINSAVRKYNRAP